MCSRASQATPLRGIHTSLLGYRRSRIRFRRTLGREPTGEELALAARVFGFGDELLADLVAPAVVDHELAPEVAEIDVRVVDVAGLGDLLPVRFREVGVEGDLVLLLEPEDGIKRAGLPGLEVRGTVED